MKNFITIENVNKYYESEGRLPDHYALDVTNFSISQGEFFCILGPSGCGKSTLLSMMAGFETPTNGKIFICLCFNTFCWPVNWNWQHDCIAD